uniref:hypothetical protein n=1 Tax=Aminipila sp. TaxID=2060095 RepID=UPI00289A7FDC
MKTSKKIMSFMLIMCLIFTSISFQAINVSALQPDDDIIISTNTSDNDNQVDLEKTDESLNNPEELSSNNNSVTNSDSDENERSGTWLTDNDVKEDGVMPRASNLEDTDLSRIDLNEEDELSPQLNKAFINGNILTLNFDELLNDEAKPDVNEFKVSIIQNIKPVINNTNSTDPVYTVSLDPAYSSSAGTTIYPVSVDKNEIREISIYGNKVVLILTDRVASSCAVSVDYQATETHDTLCDLAGNAVENFADYPVINITGGSGIPDFVVEEIYSQLDTSLLTEQLARQIYYAMIDYQGAKEELMAKANEVVNIFVQSNETYDRLTDENKITICKFFDISDEFFDDSRQRGEKVEHAIMIHAKMIGYGLTEEEIQQSIKDNTRDEVLAGKEQKELNQLNRKRMMIAASSGGDDFADVKYDTEKLLTAPFKHTDAANEQINLSSGILNYNAIDAVLPGAGGLDLVIERQYSTEQANYYNISGMIQYGTNAKGKPVYSTMKLYEREKRFAKNSDSTMGSCIENSKYKATGDDEYIVSEALRGLYSQQKIKDKGDYYSAYIYKIAMTTSTTNTMAAKQTSNPFTTNDRIWELGTGWKFNFSYIDKDTFYYDYMKLHLSDGRDFCISPNWINNLGHYTYKDVIFANESKEVRGQTSSHSVTYADGKKEYFNSDGRLIAIVDRFGNTISLTYASVNNMVDITITDSLGQVTTIKNDISGSGYDKILKLPDGQQVTYAVIRNKARELNKMRGYEKYPGQFNEYNLSKVINQGGEVTTYDYTDIECGTDFAARFKLTDKRKFMNPDSFDDGDRYYPNYYAGLSKITYPTGLTVNYEYYPRINSWYDFGCMMDIAIKCRYDKQNGKEYDRREYEYSYQYKKNGELRDLLYNADGYSKDLPDKDPFEIWNDWYIKEKDATRNITVDRGFDYHRGYCTYEKIYSGTKLVKAIYNNYNIFNQLTHPSKTKVVTESFDTSNNQMLRNIECYAYDNKGNVIHYWPALSEGNTSDTEYKVSMTYDSQYNILTGKNYKKDAVSTISEQNVLSADKKTITQSLNYENGSLKSKNDFTYDPYGNLIQNKQYTDLATGAFIESNNTYKDGTYLVEITVQNIQDADGKNLGSISRQATHDLYGRILTETDGNGNVTSYVYDKLGRLTRVQSPDNSVKTYAYDTASNKTTATDERGYIIQYQYDPAGNLTGVYSVDGGSETLLSAKEYDSVYRLIKEQNNLSEGGGFTTYDYDNRDRILVKRSGNSANQTLSQESGVYYDDKTVKTIEGDENNPSITTTEYSDKYGRILKKGQVIDGTEVFSTFTYNYLGQVVKDKSARANAESYTEECTAKYEYDQGGNVIKQTDVFGNYITTGYDAAGRKTSVTDGKSNEAGGSYKSLYTYDALGRLIEESIPFTETATAVTKYYYDRNGNLVKKQIKNSLPGTEESYTRIENIYDNKNRLIQVKSYDGSTLANQVDYQYDAAGNMTAMKTAGGTQLTTYEYDRYGNVILLTDPLGQKETYTYDVNGNMISKRDKNGATTNYTYDGLARKLSQNVTKDGVTQVETMGYTQAGALAFSQNGNLRTDYTYNGQGRIIKENDSNGVQKEYTYDVNGNVKTSAVKVNGIPKKNMSYVYDKKDRLIQVYEAGSLAAEYTYDINGNRSKVTYGNGNTIDYAYNLANLVTALKNRKGSAILSGYDYTYYLNGNQAAKADHKGRRTSYSYDGLGRLTKEAESGSADAITKSYAFDAASNRALMSVSGAEAYTVGYTYDRNNRLITETKTAGEVTNTTDYYYDNNGNTLAKRTGTLQPISGSETPSLSMDMTGAELYSYDGFDRMIGVQNADSSSVYTYRPDGLRLSKNVNGVTTTHVWEGKDITLELDGSGEVSNRYIRGIGLINSDKNGWYLFNAHGDVVQLTDS